MKSLPTLRLLVILLSASAVGCLVLAVLRNLRPHGGSYRWALQLPQTGVLVLAAAVLVATAILVARGRQNQAMLLAFVASLVGLGWLVAKGPWNATPAAVYLSPDREHVVRIDSEPGSPVRRVRVEEEGGLAPLSWLVGCVDTRHGDIETVSWDSPDRVGVRLAGSDHEFGIGPQGPVGVPAALRAGC